MVETSNTSVIGVSERREKEADKIFKEDFPKLRRNTKPQIQEIIPQKKKRKKENSKKTIPRHIP